MKKFNFRLEKLLVIREYQELEAKIKYASELQKQLNLENMNIQIQKTILKTTIDDYNRSKEGDSLNVDDIIIQQDYINNLIKMIKTNENKKNKMAESLNKLKIELMNTMKKRKILTELKNKNYEKYKKDLKKEDIKRLDEIANHLTQFI